MKSAYLLALKALPKSANKRAKVVYYMTFSDNDAGLIHQLADWYGDDFVVFATAKAKTQARRLAAQGAHLVMLGRRRLLTENAISYLKSAQVIITDDYFPELTLVDDPYVILLWHANGAIKRFGWEDPATSTRPQADQKRFKTVYGKYSAILTGSDQMGEIFERSFHVSAAVIHKIGFLRSDTIVGQPVVRVPRLDVLYAPTYRENPLAMQRVLDQAIATFAKLPQRQFMIKLHPATQIADLNTPPANVHLTQDDLTGLLSQARVLITDYSSAVFDYLLCRPHGQVVYFCPDIAAYARQPGLQPGFAEGQWGRVCVDGQQLYDTITDSLYMTADRTTQKVRQTWNQYNDGHVRKRLLALIETAMKTH